MAVLYLCALHFLFYVGTKTVALVDGSVPARGDTHGSASGRAFDRASFDRDTQDVVTKHMYRIYDKYSREHRERDGNTVRSFRALPVSNNRVLFQFNLTSIPESEVVVAATLHFLESPWASVRPRPWSCRRLRGSRPSCRLGLPPPSPGRLVLRGGSPNAASPSLVSSPRLASLPLPPPHLHRWPTHRNVTTPVRQAQSAGLLLLTAELQSDGTDPQHQQHQLDRTSASDLTSALPYLLVYTDDRAIDRPNSVATSLQRYGPTPGTDDQNRDPTPATDDQNPKHHQKQNSRPRRHTSEHLQNNLLPDLPPTEPKSRELWRNTYFPLKGPSNTPHTHHTHHGRDAGHTHTHAHTHHTHLHTPHTHLEPSTGHTHTPTPTHHAPDVGHAHTAHTPPHTHPEPSAGAAEGSRGSDQGSRGSQELRFDERTMNKARRRQGTEPRACSRRYLRVDFADIGWSDWVLAPKAFEAFYCAGTCRFPIPKVALPSNHATIQSIVRAVGIIPGVPEPCCVPDKMSALPVLYLDPQQNLVLKVYPGMSVDTCTCR